SFLFYCTQPATTWFYTLSLHDALPIYGPWRIDDLYRGQVEKREDLVDHAVFFQKSLPGHSPEQKVHPHRQDKEQHHKAGLAYFQDRKSTRLNSSHVSISYAVFCLKKKT